MNVGLLAKLDLIDHEGNTQRLGELWADRSLVLVFLRHFG